MDGDAAHYFYAKNTMSVAKVLKSRKNCQIKYKIAQMSHRINTNRVLMKEYLCAGKI